MRFDDEQTERAIRVITAVQRLSGQPLPEPEQLRETEKQAQAGDRDAADELLAARLRLIYPTLPQPPYSGERALLWQSIVSGRYEGIAVAQSLDYPRAWADLQGEGKRPALGSYFERWLSRALRQELVRATAEGWRL
ncbi:MAG: hypothetical protein IIY40_01395 [Firmicutes bacterium]|nr:hypothetical protein [Bacillota bacterium]